MKMTPAEAITAATINAAYSLGRGGEIGSLEPRQARRLRDPRLRGITGRSPTSSGSSIRRRFISRGSGFFESARLKVIPRPLKQFFGQLVY